MKKIKSLLVTSTLAVSLFTGATVSEAAFTLEEPISYTNTSYSEVSSGKKLIPWSFNAHGFGEAHKKGLKGEGIKIAVIDSGFIEKDYYQNVRKNFFEKEIVSKNRDVYDSYTKKFHGSVVLDFLVSPYEEKKLLGAVPNAEFLFYSTQVGTKTNSIEQKQELMQQAIDADVDVITMSLGSDVPVSEKAYWLEHYNYFFKDIILQAEGKNIPIVVASGNEGGRGNNVLNYYAINDYIISVGSVDSKLQLSSFSSYFEKGDTDFVGAGENLPILNDSKNSISYIKGTSYSTPYIAGMFAILKQVHPNATVSELKEMMKSISYDLGETGHDEKYGYGFPTFDNYNFEEKRAYTIDEKITKLAKDKLIKDKEKLERSKFAFLDKHLKSEVEEVNFKASRNTYVVSLKDNELYSLYAGNSIWITDLKTNEIIEAEKIFDDDAQLVTIKFDEKLDLNNSYAIKINEPRPYGKSYVIILNVIK